jgi:predicted transcriptional regulator
MIVRSCTFTVRLTPGELSQLSNIARRQGESQANTLRQALRAYATAMHATTKKEML